MFVKTLPTLPISHPLPSRVELWKEKFLFVVWFPIALSAPPLQPAAQIPTLIGESWSQKLVQKWQKKSIQRYWLFNFECKRYQLLLTAVHCKINPILLLDAKCVREYDKSQPRRSSSMEIKGSKKYVSRYFHTLPPFQTNFDWFDLIWFLFS